MENVRNSEGSLQPTKTRHAGGSVQRGLHMKKAEAETGIRYLCNKWRKDCGFSGTPENELSFETFYSWVADHHRPYLQFRATMGVRYMVELWFDEEFGQMGSR